MGQKPNIIADIAREGFFERFADQISPKPNSGCWIWIGVANNWGYGAIKILRKMRGAHRVSYECKYGPIPDGLEPDHLCRVTYCVNPDHLELVTPAENKRRQHFASRKPEFQSLEVCRNGHPWSAETRTTQHNGSLACRQCHREYNREYQRERKRRARNVKVS